jgi:dual-action HEIGH metallo-peptidase
MNKLHFKARTVLQAVLMYTVALTLSSCSKDEDVVINQTEKPAEAQLQFLENSGFIRKSIDFKNGTFIIDQDILISKEEVEAYMALDGTTPGARAEHYRGTYLVGDTYVTNIKFYIDSTVSASWATAVRGAISQWNSVNGTRLFMSEVTSSSAANTLITTGFANENWVARAYLPSSRRRPGTSLTINTKYNNLSSGYKLFTIVHEMGHIFGLYHTNQTQGIFITGTPTVDSKSVMNSVILPWNGFTNGDVKAVQILYPE